MSPEEDRIAGEAAKRGAMLPQTPSSAVQRDAVKSVTPGKSPAKSPPAKQWDGSFAKVPLGGPSLSEHPSFRASSSRESAEKAERKRRAHVEARAELLSLIAEHAGDTDVLGEALDTVDGDVSLKVALPPPKLAMREIKERKEKQAKADLDKVKRTDALNLLRKQQREHAAALREKRKETGGGSTSGESPAPGTRTETQQNDAAASSHSCLTRGSVNDTSNTSLRSSDDVAATTPSMHPTLTPDQRIETARKAEVAAFIQESKERWRLKLHQEKTAARLREQRRLEVLKQERSVAREKAREHAASKEASSDDTSSKPLPRWNQGGSETQNVSDAPLTPVRRVGTTAANADAIEAARETRTHVGKVVGKVGVSSSASRAGIASPVKGRDTSARSTFLPPQRRKQSSIKEKKPPEWIEEEARRKKQLRESASGSRIGGSAFVMNTGFVVAEERRLKGLEATERLRREIEERLEVAKAAARAVAEEVAQKMETIAPKRTSVPVRAASATAKAIASYGGASSNTRERALVHHTSRNSRGDEDANRLTAARLRRSEQVDVATRRLTNSETHHLPKAKGVLKTQNLPPGKNPKSITFSETITRSDGAEVAMAVAAGDAAGTVLETTSEDVEAITKTEVEDDVQDDGVMEDEPSEAEELRSKPRLIEQMRGPPSTFTTLPGNEHVPRAEDWLGLGQGGRAVRFARRLAKRRAPIDSDAPPMYSDLVLPSSEQAANALAAKAFSRGSMRKQSESTHEKENAKLHSEASYVRLRKLRTNNPTEPRGILSTYARRVFADAIETKETEKTLSDDLEQRVMRSLSAETSAQTDPVLFQTKNDENVEINSKPKRPSGKKKQKKVVKEKQAASYVPQHDTCAEVDDEVDDDVEDAVSVGADENSKKLAKLAALLAEEDAAALSLRASPDDLERRLQSELALYDEMGEIGAELDAMRLARSTFEAEQKASTFASLAATRREVLEETKEVIDAARAYEATVRTEEALTLREQAMSLVGGVGDEGGYTTSTSTAVGAATSPMFTEEDVQRVAEAVTLSVREETARHLKQVTDSFLQNVAKGQLNAGEVAAAELQGRFNTSSPAERLDEDEILLEPEPSPMRKQSEPILGSPNKTSDSIADEIGVPEVSQLTNESFIPEESMAFDAKDPPSDDEAAFREVTAKHDDVQRKLIDKQKELRSSELESKRRQILEMERQLAALDKEVKNSMDSIPASAEETAALDRELADSENTDDTLQAHGNRIEKLQRMVEKRRHEKLALTKLAGKETTLREEMRRLDSEITTAKTEVERDQRVADALAVMPPMRSPSPSPIPAAPGTTSPTSSEGVDSESIPEIYDEPVGERGDVNTDLEPAQTVQVKEPVKEPVKSHASPAVTPQTIDANTVAQLATATRVNAAVRVALHVSGALHDGLTPSTIEQLHALKTFNAVCGVKVDSKTLLSATEGDESLSQQATTAATLTTPDTLLFDTIIETVTKLSSNAFPATTALSKTLGAKGLAGEKLFELVSNRANKSLAPALQITDAVKKESDDAEDSAQQPNDTSAPLDAIVRDDAKASDDIGWYAVKAVEKAIAKRLADELFDEVVGDTVIAMAGVQ